MISQLIIDWLEANEYRYCVARSVCWTEKDHIDKIEEILTYFIMSCGANPFILEVCNSANWEFIKDNFIGYGEPTKEDGLKGAICLVEYAKKLCQESQEINEDVLKSSFMDIVKEMLANGTDN